MKLDELDHITKSKQIGKILEGHFGFHIDPNRINAESAQLMLDKTTEIIEEFKRSPDFHKSESNPKYLQALMIEQALESLAAEVITPSVEEREIVETPTKRPKVKAVKKAIKKAVDNLPF